MLLGQPGDELPAEIDWEEWGEGWHRRRGWDRGGDLDGGDVQRGLGVILMNDPDAEFAIGWEFDAWMDFAIGIGVEDHVGGWDGGFGGQLGDVLLSAPADGPGGR